MKKLVALLMAGIVVVPMTLATLTFAQEGDAGKKPAATDKKKAPKKKADKKSKKDKKADAKAGM